MKISRLSSTAKDLMSDDALEMVLSSEWMDFQFLTILSSRTRRNDRKTDITLLPCPPPAEIRARRSSRADDKAMTPSNAVEPLLFSRGINNDQTATTKRASATSPVHSPPVRHAQRHVRNHHVHEEDQRRDEVARVEDRLEPRRDAVVVERQKDRVERDRR